MIRIIVREQDASKAANCGGSTEIEYRTFEIEAPALEAYLRESRQPNWTYVTREIVGSELPETTDIVRQE